MECRRNRKASPLSAPTCAMCSATALAQEGESKEGAGRVALFRETGLLHLYTVEANYNMARSANIVPPASGDHGGRASPPSGRRAPPRLTADMLQVGFWVGFALQGGFWLLLQVSAWKLCKRKLSWEGAWVLISLFVSSDAGSRRALGPFSLRP